MLSIRSNLIKFVVRWNIWLHKLSVRKDMIVKLMFGQLALCYIKFWKENYHFLIKTLRICWNKLNNLSDLQKIYQSILYKLLKKCSDPIHKKGHSTHRWSNICRKFKYLLNFMKTHKKIKKNITFRFKDKDLKQPTKVKIQQMIN